MIWIAAVTEAGIQNWPDFGILLTIQFVNASLGIMSSILFPQFPLILLYLKVFMKLSKPETQWKL
jgi:hypothetical protein